jgi:signal transduction histidine kinase/CheY-like chemotaxis protein
MVRGVEAAVVFAYRRWRGFRRGIPLAIALLLPLGVPVGWLSLELQAAHDRGSEALAAGADHAGRALSDVLGRFERIATGLRLPEANVDATALTARLLRLEPQLAPASALLAVDARGRLLASSHPLGGAVLDASEAAWFEAAMAAPGHPVLTAPPAPTPLSSLDDYAVARRIDGRSGETIGVIITFLPAAALRQAVQPGWLEGYRAGIRLSDNGAGRTLIDLAADSATATPAGLASRSVASLRRLASVLPASAPATAAIDIAPGSLRWEATLDPWTLLSADSGGFVRRAIWAAALALALLLSAIFASALARIGGGGRVTTQPRTAPPSAATPTEAVIERDRVLAGIGHDVRTPLNSILGIAALLLDGELEEAQRRWVQRIRASCELLLAMLNGMLETCSAHADGTELNADDVDVAGLVREVCEVLQPQAHDKGLDLRVTVEDAALGTWRTDPTRVRQVLFNLAGNAIKYTDHGSVEVRISLAATHEGREVFRVQVTDSGPGIQPEERARIFERFQRGRGQVAAGREGVGLGLSLCRDIASLMGGALMLESTPGLGSIFTFEFPAERSPIGGHRRGAPFPGRTALVVGLSDGVRRHVALHLQGLGFAVETVADGFIGLGMAERTAATQGALDLVVLDGALSGLSAEVFLLRLRANRQFGAVRVAWVTAADAAPPASAAVDAIVPHPAEPREIERVVFELLSPTSALEAIDPEAPAAAQGRVLIVEDNKINQALLADVLGRVGFSVFTANDGEEAVHAARRGGFDLILMDVQMPGIDGIEATRRIRAAEAGGSWRTPVVALTAHTGSIVRRQCLEAGASAVLHKPINLSRLPVQLRDVIAMNRAEVAVLGTPGVPATALPADADCDGTDIEVEYLEALVLEVGVARAREAVRDFLTDTGARVSRLEELLVSAEWSAVQRNCHDLAGLAGTLGAASLADGLATLEHAARDRDTARAERAMTNITATWNKSQPALLRGLEEAVARRGNAKQGRAA